MTNEEEMLQKLTKIEGLLNKTPEVPGDVMLIATGLPFITFLFFGLIFWGFKHYNLKKDNSLKLLNKEVNLFAYGLNHGLFTTGILMLYGSVILLNEYSSTTFISIYNLAATTIIGLGISLSQTSESSISNIISNKINEKNMKEFIRNMNTDDISKLRKIEHQVSGILNNKINNNTKKDLDKIKSSINEILKNHE